LPPPSAAATRALNVLEQLALKGNRPWLAHLDAVVKKLPEFARPDDELDILLDDSENVIPHPRDTERERNRGIPRVSGVPLGRGTPLSEIPDFVTR